MMPPTHASQEPIWLLAWLTIRLVPLVRRQYDDAAQVDSLLYQSVLPALLDEALGEVDSRTKLAPASAIRLVIANLVLGREPLYASGEWAARYDPARLGLSGEEAETINDDRVGRALDALFDADRASPLTTVMLAAISEFSVDTDQPHNDSTSLSVHGAYRDADGSPRCGKATPVITHGHSKDHRPDLKQLVWILTVSADGAVPITYRLADGNTVDDPTHVPTWDGLVALTGRVDFLYVADSKLCSRQAMGHIAGRGGRFVTVMPRSRKEDAAFRDWLATLGVFECGRRDHSHRHHAGNAWACLRDDRVPRPRPMTQIPY
ncbi:MAG: IS1634 family transposase [Candidatus Nanopelagicales bacterium]|nr:IS1634 family transposase [Candidatus Nanopelagicales bacterium]